MLFPKENFICEYEGVKYLVLSSYLFKDVLLQTIIDTDADIHTSSHFYTVNWWKFMFKAKLLGKKKISNAY